MIKKKCIVIIDGSNFYFKLKDLDLHNLLSLDFTQFLLHISKKYQLVSTTYYVGRVRTDGTEKAQHMFNQQRKLFAHLKKHNVKYSLGYLLKSDGKFHEKGVDVNMALDMLVAAYENICDHIILISSDTDLLPAILKVKNKGKTVEYVGFSHQASLAMIANCSEPTLLKVDDIKPFLAHS